MHLRSFYEDQLEDRDQIEERLKGEQMGAQERMRLMTVLRSIDAVFAEAKGADDAASASNDPLAQYWEEQMEKGEDPDLDLTLEDLKAMGRI